MENGVRSPNQGCWYDLQVNPFLLYFASGESLYLGAAVLVLLVVISPFLQPPWLLRLRNISAWLTLVLIVMSSPPFAWIVDVIFGAAFLCWLIAWNKASDQVFTKIRVVTMVLLLLLLLALPTVELPHRKMPVLKGEASDHLVVIGDSISSGLGTRVTPWPAVMQGMSGVEVRNVLSPGATVADGLAMAQRVGPDDRLILIELGGNDLIAGESLDVFARGLEAVLARLTVAGRMIVMFELPLLPDRIAYGRIQRRLARKYGVSLIPKRYLTDVIAGQDATSDGLHLSDVGARRMAAVVTKALFLVLKTQHGSLTAPATRS